MTDEAKHTPGWMTARNSRVGVVDSRDGVLIMVAKVFSGTSGNPEMQLANTARIAACWNACEGVPVKALEDGLVQELRDDLLSILRMLNTAEGLGEWEAMDSHFEEGIAERAKMDAARNKALATLAKAKGAQS